MTDATEPTGPITTADGTSLKKSLHRALRRQKIRALMLIAPLLLFILITFIAPIFDMLLRSVENQIVPEILPRTVASLESWDPETQELPDEATYASFYTDLTIAAEYKIHSRVGSRLNYENPGIASLFRSTGRKLKRFDTDIYGDQFIANDAAFEDPKAWQSWMSDEATRAALPLTADAYDGWAKYTVEANKDDPLEEKPGDIVYTALYRDLSGGAAVPAAMPSVDVSNFDTVSIKELFGDVQKGWVDPVVWKTIKLYGGNYTSGYFLNSVDMQLTPDGAALKAEEDRIYITLLIRTIILSLAITFSTIMLGYPVAFLLANLPMRSANVLMILVLLPFWTSLLVRTSAWKVLLQDQGVINDILVWAHIVSDDNRLALINNATGTVIAMTHILLPFMILPLYSVMKTINPSYVRAAKSMGANDWTSFWRVYFPNSVPGIGAGSILVFILSIGYYITPELVGGTKGVFISNRIAYHISYSLNWGLAAALGSILLILVLALYWVYDRVVGIDNVKLGG
ncbi:MAG: ABC transporter permease [Maritimibacter sp.]